MFYISLFIFSSSVGTVFAFAQRKRKKQEVELLQKTEISTLQKKLDLEIESILKEAQKKNLSLEIKNDLLQTAAQHDINVDEALLLYNRICFLKEKI